MKSESCGNLGLRSAISWVGEVENDRAKIKDWWRWSRVEAREPRLGRGWSDPGPRIEINRYFRWWLLISAPVIEEEEEKCDDWDWSEINEDWEVAWWHIVDVDDSVISIFLFVLSLFFPFSFFLNFSLFFSDLFLNFSKVKQKKLNYNKIKWKKTMEEDEGSRVLKRRKKVKL